MLNIMPVHWILFSLSLFYFNTCTEASPVVEKMIDMTHVFDSTTLKPPQLHGFRLIVRKNNTVEEGYWFQMEDYYSGIHAGTHMDAPSHFKKGGTCVDEIPIDRFIAPAAVIDITEQAEENSDYLVTIRDIQRWEEQTGDSLNGKIVLIRSGWGRRWPDKEAFIGTATEDKHKMHAPGMSAEASQWLVDNRDIIGLGTETLSLDNGQNKNNHMAHQILLGANTMYGLECLANMDKLPIIGAKLYVFPMKIGNASGAPVRVIAIFPSNLSPEEPCDK